MRSGTPTVRYGRLQSGMTLVTALFVIGLVVVLVSTIVITAFCDLGVASQTQNNQTRLNLAESAISLAISDAVQHYTTSGWTPGVYQVLAPGATSTADGFGLVTFQSPGPNPWSTNNLGGSGTAPGFDRVVPPSTLHLIGMGTQRGQVLYTEVLVNMPPYPYAVAAAGQILSTGTLLVAGVNNSGQLTNPCGTPSGKGGWLPADVANNATTNPYAVCLGTSGVVNITGDLTSVGAISVPPAGSIVSAIEPFSNPIPIPTINAASYDPQAQGIPFAPVSGSCAAPYTFTNPLTGWARSSGNLTVDGPILLQSGALYVDGDLTASGGISGVGAVFVNGNVQLGSGTSLSSNSSLALVANGDIHLTSAGGSCSNTLEGVVYAGGSLNANNFTIVGSYVANSGNVSMNNSSVIYAPDKASFAMSGSGSGLNTGLLVTLAELNIFNLPSSITNLHVNATPLVSNPTTDNDFSWVLTFTQNGTPQTLTLTGTGLVSQLTTWNTDPLLASAVANLIVNGTSSPLLNTVLSAAELNSLLGTDWTSQAIAAAQQAANGGSSSAVAVNFNQFLDPMQRARILLWHVISSPTPLP